MSEEIPEPSRAETVARIAAEAAAARIAEQFTAQLEALTERVAALETRPSLPPGFNDLAERVAALETRPPLPAGLAETLREQILADLKLAALEGRS